MELIRKYFVLGAVVVLAQGALFAFLGVYDSDKLPFFDRFIFWTSTMVTGTVATAFVAPWVLNSALRDRHTALQVIAVALIISLPITFVILLFNAPSGYLLSPQVWGGAYMSVAAISLVLVAGGYVGLRAFGLIGAVPQLPEVAILPDQKFMERLPVKYRGANLYAISSEDHYLRVHTDRGEELILMRLSDAMRELDIADGFQTHRSWWVARAGVTDVSRENGKQSLMLKSGVVAPVSRSFSKAIQDVGLGA